MGLFLRALVPAALALVLGIAATSGGSKLAPGAEAGNVKFSQTIGTVLPTHAGRVIVSVLCIGPPKSLCRGNARLVPRGATRQELGAAPIAGRSFKLKEGGSDLQLDLSGRARTALGNHAIAVTVQLRTAGKIIKTKAATVTVGFTGSAGSAASARTGARGRP